MSVYYRSLTDLLDQVQDNQIHDKDCFDGLTEEEIYQIKQFYLFEQNEEFLFFSKK